MEVGLHIHIHTCVYIYIEREVKRGEIMLFML